MGGEAASWLMANNAPALGFFTNLLETSPAPAAPESPQDGPYSDDDPDYDDYLAQWIRAVERGEFEESGNLTGYWVSDMIPGITYTDFVRGRAV